MSTTFRKRNTFITKLIENECNISREEANRTLYFNYSGMYQFSNKNEITENGFQLVHEWSDYYRQVYINENELTTITICEGDLSVVLLDSKEAYDNEIKLCVKFYDEN